jgi:secreted trypsin-like serine protease
VNRHSDGLGAGVCQGDSGGPMVDAQGRVAAVTGRATRDRARRCGEYSIGVVLTRERAWLDETMAAFGRRAAWE